MTEMTSAAAETDGSSPEPVLSVQHISVRFGGVAALSDVSLDVASATIAGLVGPNGAGKTTLFSVVSGLHQPDSGRVTICGQDVTKRSPQDRARNGLARTFQHPQLFDPLTVREHLTLAHRLHHSRARLWTDLFTLQGFRPSRGPEANHVSEILNLLRIDRLADTQVQALPLGLTRLVEVGQALASEPRILLLDEPSAGLNPQETRALGLALETIVERSGVAMLLVEHDLDLVLGLSEKVFVLEFGTLIASGSPTEIRGDERVRAAYLGVPACEAEQR